MASSIIDDDRGSDEDPLRDKINNDTRNQEVGVSEPDSNTKVNSREVQAIRNDGVVKHEESANTRDELLPTPPSSSGVLAGKASKRAAREDELQQLRSRIKVLVAEQGVIAKKQSHIASQSKPARRGQPATGEEATDKPSASPPEPTSCSSEPHTLLEYKVGMAPARQKPLLKEKFVPIFSKLRTSTYVDTPLTRQPPPSHAIRTISWNALGTLIATGAADRTLRIWNPERTNVKYSTELRGHSGPVEKVEFNPTHESELASCSADGTVRLWDVRRKESIVEIKPNIGGIDLLAWKPDGGELIIGRQARDTETSSTLIPVPRSTLTPSTPLNCETPVSSLSFTHSTTNPSLLLCSTTGALTLHRYPDLSKLHTLRAHTSPLLSHSLNPPATLLATGGSDALITLWDTQDWVCVRKLDRSVGPVTSVSFSFDGSYVVGGSDEGTGLDIAHAETGEYVHSIDTNWPSPCVQWHPHRYVLAYTSDSGLRIIGASSTT